MAFKGGGHRHPPGLYIVVGIQSRNFIRISPGHPQVYVRHCFGALVVNGLLREWSGVHSQHNQDLYDQLSIVVEPNAIIMDGRHFEEMSKNEKRRGME